MHTHRQPAPTSTAPQVVEELLPAVLRLATAADPLQDNGDLLRWAPGRAGGRGAAERAAQMHRQRRVVQSSAPH